MAKIPPNLSKEATVIWKSLASEYGIDDPGGMQVLKIYCEAYDRAAACRVKIDLEGMLLHDRFDQMKAHPLLTTEKDARSTMLAALRQLNLDVLPNYPTPGRPPGR